MDSVVPPLVQSRSRVSLVITIVGRLVRAVSRASKGAECRDGEVLHDTHLRGGAQFEGGREEQIALEILMRYKNHVAPAVPRLLDISERLVDGRGLPPVGRTAPRRSVPRWSTRTAPRRSSRRGPAPAEPAARLVDVDDVCEADARAGPAAGAAAATADDRPRGAPRVAEGAGAAERPPVVAAAAGGRGAAGQRRGRRRPGARRR